MPELPEVTTIIRIVKEDVLNKTISHVEVFANNTIEGDVEEFKETLKNKTILDITRVGKFLLFHLSEDIKMISHLRMEGKYFFFEEANPSFNNHDLVKFHFNDNTTLIYNDTRRFGKMTLRTGENYLTSDPLKKVAKDPLNLSDADKEDIIKKIGKDKRCIKEILLDQTIVSGLGNIYVDETLYACKISPFCRGFALKKEKILDILSESKRILEHAIRLNGSTVKSYHPSKNLSGFFQDELLCYGMENKECPTCHHRFSKVMFKGRGTTYCPHCQVNKDDKILVGVTGPIASGKSTIAKSFEKLGYHRINFDEIISELYSQNEVIERLSKICKYDLKTTDNKIDKNKLRELLTKDRLLLKKVEKYLFPLTYMKAKEIIDADVFSRLFVLEIPLLYESKGDKFVNYIVYVDIDDNTQKERLLSRGSNLELLSLNKSNYDAFNNKRIADFVITNNETINSIDNKINKINCQILYKD